MRLVWERDGVEYVDTVAVGWSRSRELAWIDHADPRHGYARIWLHIRDVKRR